MYRKQNNIIVMDDILARYPMCCDIPAESWYDLSNSIKISICNAETMSVLRKKHIKYSSAIIQSKSFVQLSLYANLNLPHGHRDLLNHNDNCVVIKVISAVDKLKEGEMVQHIEYISEKMDHIFIYILNRLKLKFKNIIKKKEFGQGSIVGKKMNNFDNHYLKILVSMVVSIKQEQNNLTVLIIFHLELQYHILTL